MVALVRDRDDLLAEAEREQELGRVGHEADDAHPPTLRAIPRRLARTPCG